ncbi:MAG: alginate lyase family protein [Gaiellales bacterium]
MPRWADEEWLRSVRALVEPRRDKLAADAERIASGELDLWGRSVACDPGRLPWHADPIHHEPFDARTWHRSGHDWKPIWELHRQQHLIALAAGGRKAWAEAALGQLIDWIDRNPPGSSPGWSSGYEVAHRLVGWAFAIPLLADHVPGAALEAVSRSYADQAAFVAHRPSRYSSANNHRLAELGGLLAAARLGAVELEWDALWSELEAETVRQTFADGGSREQAAGYFLYVLEILFVAAFLARSGGRPLGRVAERLEAMLSWLAAVADVEGEPPFVGDDAEDRLLRLEYFGPRRAAALAGRVRMLLDAEAPASAPTSIVTESGYAVLRSELAESPVRVVFDIGGLGFGSLAAHGHADALSVLVDVSGQAVLRDSGTGTYAPGARREWYRSTAAHNTVTVDARSQARSLGPHLWGRRYQTTLEAASLGAGVDYVRASHDGYRRQAGTNHVRSLTFVKPGLLLVLDRVRSSRNAAADLVWNVEGDQPLTVAALPGAVQRDEQGPYSPRYTWEEQRPRLLWSSTGREIIFATAVALFGGPPPIDISHDGSSTFVELGDLRVTERWMGERAEVNSY